MTRGAAILLALGLAQPAVPQDETKEERLVLPSGLSAYLHETRSDRPAGDLVYRFRFVAPAFSGQEDFAVLTADLEFLCNIRALPLADKARPRPDRIVVSLADKPSEFGRFDPDVTQIFETFSVKDGTCIWEIF